MPLRVALTGTTAGPDVPEQMRLLVGTKGLLGGKAAEGLVDLDARMAQLKAWLESQ